MQTFRPKASSGAILKALVIIVMMTASLVVNGTTTCAGSKFKFTLTRPENFTAPEIAAIAASGTGRITATKAAITNPFANRIEMPGAYFHLSGVSTPNLIENCVFVAKNSLFLGGDAAAGSLTLRGNSFSGSFETLWDPNPLYNVVNLSLFADATVEDNSFLNGCTMGSGFGMRNLSVQNNTFDNPRGPAILIAYVHNDVNIKCNAFKFDPSNTFAGSGIKLNAKVNSANELGSASSPVGNSWPNSANIDISTLSFQSSTFQGLTSPITWTSIDNNSTTAFKYFKFRDEFVGSLSGIQYPAVNNVSGMSGNTNGCTNNDVKFALRQGVTTSISNTSVESGKPYLFPNPVSDQLTISFGDSKINQVQILNSLGVMVSTQDVEIGLSSLDISTANLPSGIYFLILNASDTHSSLRFVKK